GGRRRGRPSVHGARAGIAVREGGVLPRGRLTTARLLVAPAAVRRPLSFRRPVPRASLLAARGGERARHARAIVRLTSLPAGDPMVVRRLPLLISLALALPTAHAADFSAKELDAARALQARLVTLDSHLDTPANFPRPDFDITRNH